MSGLYLASLLSTFEQIPELQDDGCRSDYEIMEMLTERGPWERKFQVQLEDLEGNYCCKLLLVFSLNHRSHFTCNPRRPHRLRSEPRRANISSHTIISQHAFHTHSSDAADRLALEAGLLNQAENCDARA